MSESALAGASTVAGLLCIFVLLLFIGGFWSLLRDVAFQVHGDVPFWPTLWQSILRSVRMLPGYFWSARWGMLVMGLIGVVLAVVDAQRERIRRPWRDQLGFVVTVGIVAAGIISVLYADLDTLHSFVAERPDLFYLQSALILSHTRMLVLGSIVAFGAAGIVWLAWNWGYDLWAPKLGVQRPIALWDVPAPPDDYHWREPQELMMWHKRANPKHQRPAASVSVPSTRAPARGWKPLFVFAFVAVSLLVYLFLQVYRSVGPEIMSGERWVREDSPQVTVVVPLSKTPRRIVFSNSGGHGIVGTTLSSGSGSSSSDQRVRLPLSQSAARYGTAELDLQGLAPGRYRLELSLQEGRGGLVRYVVLYGGGTAAQLVAVAFGVASGVWLAMITILLLELLIKGGWL